MIIGSRTGAPGRGGRAARRALRPGPRADPRRRRGPGPGPIAPAAALGLASRGVLKASSDESTWEQYGKWQQRSPGRGLGTESPRRRAAGPAGCGGAASTLSHNRGPPGPLRRTPGISPTGGPLALRRCGPGPGYRTRLTRRSPRVPADSGLGISDTVPPSPY
eukprot:764525-Hanusia_phi.AAC.2